MFKRSNNLALPHQSGRNCEKNKVKTEILEVNGSTRQPMKKVCVYTGGVRSLWRENGRVWKSGEWLAGIICGVGVGCVCGCECV